MIKYYLFILILFFNPAAFSQQLSFLKVFADSSKIAGALTGCVTFDNGYILGGSSYSSWNSDQDICLAKTDSFGNLQWMKTYGTVTDDYVRSMQQTSDGGFILASNTYTSVGNNDMLLLKIDTGGSLQWSKRFDSGNNGDDLEYVMQTTDSGFILIGFTYNVLPCCRSDISVIKTDIVGNIQWHKTYHGWDAYEFGTCIRQTSDGGYILTGSKEVTGGGSQWDIWTIKLDANGNKTWEKSYGKGRAESIRQTADNGYIMAGFCDPYYSYSCLIKTDSAGNLQWHHAFRPIGPSSFSDGYDVKQTHDGGFIMIGNYVNNGFFIRTDPNGDTLWSRAYSGIGYTNIYAVDETPDYGFSFYGITIDSITLQRWMVIGKTDSLGHIICGETNWQFQDTTFMISTNPSSSVSITGVNTISLPVIASSIENDSSVCTNALPATMFEGANTICPGSCTDFNNLSLNADSFQWNFPGAIPDSSLIQNPQQICYGMPGFYDVRLIAYNQYGTDTLLLPGYIHVLPYPPPQSIFQSGDTLFSIPGTGNYQWYFDGGLIPGATDYFFIAIENGDYNMVYTDSNSCEVEAVINDVITSISLALFNGEEDLILFPNPSGDKLFIHLSENASSNLKKISIFNSLGEKVATKHSTEEKNHSEFIFDTSELPSGIYFIELSGLENNFRKKFVKE